jgi:hypothetical protein
MMATARAATSLAAKRRRMRDGDKRLWLGDGNRHCWQQKQVPYFRWASHVRDCREHANWTAKAKDTEQAAQRLQTRWRCVSAHNRCRRPNRDGLKPRTTWAVGGWCRRRLMVAAADDRRLAGARTASGSGTVQRVLAKVSDDEGRLGVSWRRLAGHPCGLQRAVPLARTVQGHPSRDSRAAELRLGPDSTGAMT